MGVDTARDNDTEVLLPPNPKDPKDRYSGGTNIQTSDAGARREEGQLIENAGLIMPILSQGFQTAIERKLDRSLPNVQKQIRERDDNEHEKLER